MRFTMILLYGRAGEGAGSVSGPMDAKQCVTAQIEADDKAVAELMAQRVADRLLVNLIEAGTVTTWRTLVILTPDVAIANETMSMIEPLPKPKPVVTEPSRYYDTGGWRVAVMEQRP